MILPILSGLLVGTSYIPFPPWALLFCFVPLWLLWAKENRLSKVFWTGWLAQFVFLMFGFHWVAYTAVEFGHLPWIVGILALLAFSSFSALHLPLAGVFWKWLSKRLNLRPVPSMLLLAFTYSLFEFYFPMIFPFNWGYPWYWSGLPIYQTADIWGFQGLSFFSVLFNVFFFFIWQWRKDRKRVARPIILATLLFVFLNGLGVFRERALPPTDKLAKILAVQANIGNLEKHYAERGSQFRDVIMDKYFNITRDGLKTFPDSELIIFPETAMPISLDSYFDHQPNVQKFKNFNREIQKPILTGAYSEDPTGTFISNAFFLFNKDSELLSMYRKTVLLAFGEYFPGAQTFPFLKKLVPAISDFKPGSGPIVLNWGDINLGPLICYEGLYPDFTELVANKNAHLFTNVTNDSWFGTTFEPHQHLYMTLSRAIEFRRPVVRITNTGITTVALASGQVLEKSPLKTEWFGQYNVGYYSTPPTTIFQKGGRAAFPWIMGLGIILLAFFGRKR